MGHAIIGSPSKNKPVVQSAPPDSCHLSRCHLHSVLFMGNPGSLQSLSGWLPNPYKNRGVAPPLFMTTKSACVVLSVELAPSSKTICEYLPTYAFLSKYSKELRLSFSSLYKYGCTWPIPFRIQASSSSHFCALKICLDPSLESVSLQFPRPRLHIQGI